MSGADWKLILFIAYAIWIIINMIPVRRPRLIACLGQPASFPDGREESSRQLLTHSLILANVGRGEAFNVRLSHQVLPQFDLLFPKKFTVSPAIQYKVKTTETGGGDIVIPVLTAHQQVTITYLYEPPLTAERIHGEIRSNGGTAKLVSTMPMAEYPWWLTLLGVQLLEIIVVIVLVYYFLKVAKAILA